MKNIILLLLVLFSVGIYAEEYKFEHLVNFDNIRNIQYVNGKYYFLTGNNILISEDLENYEIHNNLNGFTDFTPGNMLIYNNDIIVSSLNYERLPLRYKNGKWDFYEPISNEYNYRYYFNKDNNNNLWTYTKIPNLIFYKYNIDNEELFTYDTGIEFKSNFNNYFSDEKGRVWYLSKEGSGKNSKYHLFKIEDDKVTYYNEDNGFIKCIIDLSVTNMDFNSNTQELAISTPSGVAIYNQNEEWELYYAQTDALFDIFSCQTLTSYKNGFLIGGSLNKKHVLIYLENDKATLLDELSNEICYKTIYNMKSFQDTVVILTDKYLGIIINDEFIPIEVPDFENKYYDRLYAISSDKFFFRESSSNHMMTNKGVGLIENNKFKQINLPSTLPVPPGSINDFKIDRNDDLWFIYSVNYKQYILHNQYNKLEYHGTFSGLPNDTIKYIHSQGDNVWFGAKSYLLQYNLTDEKWTFHQVGDGLDSIRIFEKITSNKYSELFLSSYLERVQAVINGVTYSTVSYQTYKFSNNMFSIMTDDENDDKALHTNNFIISINCDKDGNPWFISAMSSMLQQTNELYTYKNDIFYKIEIPFYYPAQQISKQYVVKIDPYNRPWIGFDWNDTKNIYYMKGAIGCYDNGEWKFITYDNGLPHSNLINEFTAIYDIHFDKLGDMWLAGSFGVAKYDWEKFEVIRPEDGLSGVEAKQIEEDSNGNLYVLFDNRTITKIHRNITSVEETNNSSHIRIFPQPAQEFINIRTTALITNTELTDILGRTVYKQSGNVEQISTAGLAPGLYLLKLYTAAGEVLTEKVVIR